jgi:hypothetical protein
MPNRRLLCLVLFLPNVVGPIHSLGHLGTKTPSFVALGNRFDGVTTIESFRLMERAMGIEPTFGRASKPAALGPRNVLNQFSGLLDRFRTAR